MKKWIQNTLIAAIAPCLALTAQTTGPDQNLACDSTALYFGGFGGSVFPYDVTVTQMGTVFLSEFAGGALDVTAKGTAPGRTRGFGGLHVGYEWMHEMRPGFRLAPALELEGSYFANPVKKADLANPTERLDAIKFTDTLPMRIGTLLANGILEFNNDYISPYIGLGVGVGFVSIHGASSLQTDPLEAGINHFNSDTSDFKSLFATQAKAGLRYRFLKHYRLSAEYRFFYLTSSDFILGSTSYPTHAPTSPWIVKLNGMAYNAFSLGIDFIF
jgi:opacity protein-like surface antigen